MRVVGWRVAVALSAAALLCAGVTSRRVAAAGSDAPAAPPRLEQTGLYADGRIGVVAPENRPYSPQYPLWSDGAVKTRWVYLPPGTTIDTSSVAEWDFPVGTRFWKEFAFDGRKVETRFLWRASRDAWVFGSYVWNDPQTEAVLASEYGEPNVLEVSSSKYHSIPSVYDCQACHGSRRVEPLGFNALQLSADRDPHAIHGEPLEPGMVTLDVLDRERRFRPARPELVATPPRIAARDPRTRSVLGYLSANCGTCHNQDEEIAVRWPSLKHGDVLDGDRVAQALVGHRTSWQVPGVPDGTSVLIDPDAPESSATLVRMRTRSPSKQMPPLGTVVVDAEAVAAVEAWIRGR